MWLAILGFLNGLADLASKYASYLSDERLREAGRNEVRLAAIEEKVKAYAIAQEVDAKPTPASKSAILNRL
jgi:hypothetical protein